MSTDPSHWQHYHRRWSTIAPPLRPTPETVHAIVHAVGKPKDGVLLLGVTPELALAFPRVVAVDKSTAMIANIWPGNAPDRTVYEADWLELTGALGRFSAVVGDGSCNAVSYPEEFKRLLLVVRDCLHFGGRFVCRIYERPARPDTLDDIVESASRPGLRGFHGFKWQLAMYIAETTRPSVPVEHIRRTFNDLFPDRHALSRRTGWSRTEIDTIDAYEGSRAVYCFPNRREIVSAAPDGLEGLEFRSSGTYDLSERCPILICHRR